MFVAFAHAFSRALHFHSALILRARSPFEGIWSSKRSNESGTQKRPSRSLLRCLSFKPIHCDYSSSPTFPRVALKVLVQKELFVACTELLCCSVNPSLLLSLPSSASSSQFPKLSDRTLNLRRISFQFGQFANFKALFPAVPTDFAKEKFAAAFGIYRCHNHIKV